MTQLAQRLRLNLPNTLTRNIELRAHFFERALPPILKAEAQSQHALFACAERLKRCNDLLTSVCLYLVAMKMLYGLASLGFITRSCPQP